MKTLDEVIEGMDHVEFCCTNCKLQFDCDEVECFLEDALHYLKAYRDDKNDLTALRAYWAEQQANPPLTWEELQQMARKPVWVEWKNPRRIPRWWIVDLNEKPDPVDGLIAISTSGTRLEYLRKREQGDVWQAYRKER